MSASIPAVRGQIESEKAVRAIFVAAALGAIVVGAIASLGSPETVVFAAIVGVLVVAALTLPVSWLALTAAVLVPLQLYFEIPGSSLALRGAVVFIFTACMRVIAMRIAGRQTIWQAWFAPSLVFLAAALFASIGAASRYLALRGIYDWLVIFATAVVIGGTVRSAAGNMRIAVALVAAGTLEGVLGLAQSAAGLSRVLDGLRLPISSLVLQPNLLRDRLVDLSFNWLAADRVLPFGTFINDIDYSIFVAAGAALALGLVFARFERTAIRKNTVSELLASAGLAICFLLMCGVVVLTAKGSGAIALVGGVAVVLLYAARRASPRAIGWGLVLVAASAVFVLSFAGPIEERVMFLVQREQGAIGTAGRLEIWQGLLQNLAGRPVFGYGLNHAALMTVASATLSNGAFALTNPSAESAYVAALIETGIVGFGALLGLIAVVLVRAAQRAREEARFVGVIAALVAIWVGNLTVEGFTTDQNGMLMGLLIGMVFAEWKRP